MTTKTDGRQASLFRDLEERQKGTEHRPEAFSISDDGSTVVRRLRRTDGTVAESTVDLAEGAGPSDSDTGFDYSWLRLREPPAWSSAGEREIRIVDLFSGVGGLTLGVSEAARAAGLAAKPVLGLDSDETALGVFAENFPEAETVSTPIEDCFDSEIGRPPSDRESEVRVGIGDVDFLVGGPPCQGHSNLNNHTRRADPRNALFAYMVRAAEVIRPRHLLIENVPQVVHDEKGVVQTAVLALRKLGYEVDTRTVNAAVLGVSQRRRRFFLLASKEKRMSIGAAVSRYRRETRGIRWAIADLEGLESDDVFDTPSTPSEENQRRIEYLFDHDLYDLPDDQRPDCHRLKDHSYRAVYGRMQWDRPAQTITTGFGSTGQGRNVHPSRRRTITPHEAARLQFFPDFFDFGDTGRAALQEMIGNAVPPKMAYVLTVDLLR